MINEISYMIKETSPAIFGTTAKYCEVSMKDDEELAKHCPDIKDIFEASKKY